MLTLTIADIARWTIAASLLAVLVSPTAAQEEQFREREVLDPESDEWVARPAEEAAAPPDALDEARRRLAQGEARQAYKLLKRWTEENPGHERFFEAMYLLGEAQFERGRFYQAYESYEVVAENTAGELFYKALRREMDVARAFLSGEKRIVWGFLRLPAYDDGIEILDRIWERVPGTRLGESALKLKADYFFQVGDVDLAQDEYVNLVREYPNGRYVQLAMLRAAEAAAAAFPGIEFDDRALLDAQVRYRQLQNTFPAYAEREHVADRLEGTRQQRAEKDLSIARWYERTNRTGAAEFYYRLILKERPDTLAAGEARRRLRALGVELPEEEAQP
jgi:outer membrane protein assembly factor BamD (BamD/ComL family)